MSVRRAATAPQTLGIVAGLVLGGAVACAPRFQSGGSLAVDGAAFAPATCHVHTGCATVELTDAGGNRLGLSIPPQRLDAWQSIGGTPEVAWTPAGGARQALGTCGSLQLTGEGYHGSGKRAASGRVVLACPRVSGALDFTGCF